MYVELGMGVWWVWLFDECEGMSRCKESFFFRTTKLKNKSTRIIGTRYL